MDIILKAKKRKILGKKNKQLRKQGYIPAVIYGHQFEALPLQVDAKEFAEVLKKAGESTLIRLEIGEGKSHPVLIHDLTRDPVTDEILHIDFYRIKAGEEITAEIPLVFEGVSPAVKDLGGVLLTNIKSVKITALPKDLPKDIKVDVSLLKTFEDHIKISDLAVPTGVKIEGDAEEIVALVKPPRTEAEIEALQEEVQESVEEVEGVSKESEEGKERESAEKEQEPNT